MAGPVLWGQFRIVHVAKTLRAAGPMYLKVFFYQTLLKLSPAVSQQRLHKYLLYLLELKVFQASSIKHQTLPELAVGSYGPMGSTQNSILPRL